MKTILTTIISCCLIAGANAQSHTVEYTYQIRKVANNEVIYKFLGPDTIRFGPYAEASGISRQGNVQRGMSSYAIVLAGEPPTLSIAKASGEKLATILTEGKEKNDVVIEDRHYTWKGGGDKYNWNYFKEGKEVMTCRAIKFTKEVKYQVTFLDSTNPDIEGLFIASALMATQRVSDRKVNPLIYITPVVILLGTLAKMQSN